MSAEDDEAESPNPCRGPLIRHGDWAGLRAPLPRPGGRWPDVAVAELEAAGRRFGIAAQRLLLFVVRFHQLVLRPLTGERCRFHPSCSRYAATAILEHGPWRGVVLAAWRLLRCHPWTPGGLDPVPPLFEWPLAERGRSTSAAEAECAVPPRRP